MFKIKKNKLKIQFFCISLNLSLLLVMAESFLLPNFAYATNITEKNIIELTNIERIENNIKPLKENQQLKKAAFKKAEAIVENGIFSHTIENNSFSKWIKDAEYEYSFIGENLAIDFVSSEGTINAWLNSPTHKENLLNEKFEETGVAVYEGKFDNSNTIIIVQIFGTPIKAMQTTSNQDEPKNEEKLYVKLENNRIINHESNIIIAKTLDNNIQDQAVSKNIDTLSPHPLTSNSQTGEFFYFLFAIIISSLIISIMFPHGLRIKKICYFYEIATNIKKNINYILKLNQK